MVNIARQVALPRQREGCRIPAPVVTPGARTVRATRARKAVRLQRLHSPERRAPVVKGFRVAPGDTIHGMAPGSQEELLGFDARDMRQSALRMPGEGGRPAEFLLR